MRKMLFLCGVMVLLSGCLSTSEYYGQGELKDSSQLKQKYLKQVSFTYYWGKTASRYTAFAVDPNGQKTGVGRDMSPSAAANSALVQCGEECKLFSEMHEVVWREFHKAAEYNRYKEIIEAYEDIELRYFKDYEFVIGEVQQVELTNNYFPSLLKQKKDRRWVIALSPDGQSYFKFQHLNYLRDWRWRNAKKITLAACNAISGRDDCVIYAENEKIYE